MFKRIFHGVVLFTLLAGLLAISPVTPARAAAIIYVNDDAAGSNNGSSWANAYTNLQTALTFAQVGDEIWVAAGTYKPTTDANRAKSFALRTGVALYGGFAGTESSLSERNPSVNVTILSGDIGTPNDISDNSYHVVNGSSSINTAILDGFTITDGNAAAPADNGGGIYIITGASPTLVNLVISGNHADSNGGGMYVHVSGAPSLTNVIFSGNSAVRGGGMFNFGANPTLTDVTFSNNISSDMGGGMYNTDGGVPSLTNVTFKGNTAENWGGGMRNMISNPTLTNVTFSGNSATVGGGAIHNVGSNPSLNNVTIKGNTATDGGAIYNSSSNPVISNSILYGNSGGEFLNSSSVPVVTYSIVQGGYAGTGNLNVNPLLEALADNGGFTQTMSLGAGSPALNKGNNATCAAADQRGITRPQGGTCDMGAFEAKIFTLTLRSIGAQDGWVLESAEASKKGGSKDSAATYFRLGDAATDTQYRAILSFNTAGLPDNAAIASVTLKVKQTGVPIGSNPFDALGVLKVDIRKPFFGASAGLANSDFEAAAGKNGIGNIPNTPVNNWYTKAWTVDTFFLFINRTGPTQFRLRFFVSDTNDGGADYMKFLSGNHATVSARPTLIIQYYIP
jgi:predicted outer membrane repeat protein/parallel beta-helix repeat protein